MDAGPRLASAIIINGATANEIPRPDLRAWDTCPVSPRRWLLLVAQLIFLLATTIAVPDDAVGYCDVWPVPDPSSGLITTPPLTPAQHACLANYQEPSNFGLWTVVVVWLLVDLVIAVVYVARRWGRQTVADTRSEVPLASLRIDVRSQIAG